MPLWRANDLTKAFDRVVYGPLFEVLLGPRRAKTVLFIMAIDYRPFIEIKSARCFGLGNAQMEKKMVGEIWLERCKPKIHQHQVCR